ncbi:unnamed protein product [Gordionus sp. m RMFG-2023]|uniref:antistasin-like n=1 Tax=Gordionus sp. m RMFG-2023 TaxID=3053472 RepID=UPI0030E33F06
MKAYFSFILFLIFVIVISDLYSAKKQDDIQAKCQNLKCTLECPNGYQKDGMGCDICSVCLEETNKCPESSMCLKYCKDGFKKDSSDCNICECNVTPKTKMICPILDTCGVYCSHGRRKDSNNCEMCSCQRPEKKKKIKSKE